MKKLINIIIVVIVAGVLIKACNRAAEVGSWPETKGVIASYTVESYRDSEKYTDHNGTKRTRYKTKSRIKFLYNFQVDGISYTGIYKINNLRGDSDINRKLKMYPSGKTVRVKYDPEDPADSEVRI